MIAITVDTDWAPTYMIEDTLALLDEHGLAATVFSTHDDGLALDPHERALHPNYFEGIAGDDLRAHQRAVLSELCETFPDAIGARSHSLLTNHPLRRAHADHGILYESNYLMYGADGLSPTWVGDWTVECPIYFQDDVWLKCDLGGASGDPSLLNAPPEFPDVLAGPGLKVFLFHPQHVFMNAPDVGYRREALDGVDVDDGDAVAARRYDGYGARSLFEELLEWGAREDHETATLGRIARRFVEGSDRTRARRSNGETSRTR